MNMKVASPVVRATMRCALILFGLLLAPVALLSGLGGGMPDQLAFPLVEQRPLLEILWASNPRAAMQILAQQPLMEIARGDPASVVPAWKLIFYPASLAVQLAVSILAAFILCPGDPGAVRRRLVSLLPGMAVLVFVTTYAQLASCCTGGPRWLLDVLLYSLAYNTFDTLINWQAFYSGIAWALPFAQLGLALSGAALLLAAAGRARHVNARTNPHRDHSGSPETPS